MLTHHNFKCQQLIRDSLTSSMDGEMSYPVGSVFSLSLKYVFITLQGYFCSEVIVGKFPSTIELHASKAEVNH